MHHANYAYLGAGTIVEVDEPDSELLYTLKGVSGGTDPDTGDIYHGLDRFGRVKDLVCNGCLTFSGVRQLP